MIKLCYSDSVSYKELFEKREIICNEQGKKLYTVGTVGTQVNIFDKNKRYVGEIVKKSNDLVIFHVDTYGNGKIIGNNNNFTLVYNDWGIEFCDSRFIVTCGEKNLSCHYMHGQKCFEIFDEDYINVLATLDAVFRVIWDEILHGGV